jgi:isoleucyl-tRNA synthetase
VTIALDTAITAEPAAGGIARDVVRVVQQARRAAGLEVVDRIALSIGAPAAVQVRRGFLEGETLAEVAEPAEAPGGGFPGAVGEGVLITAIVVER